MEVRAVSIEMSFVMSTAVRPRGRLPRTSQLTRRPPRGATAPDRARGCTDSSRRAIRPPPTRDPGRHRRTGPSAPARRARKACPVRGVDAASSVAGRTQPLLRYRSPRPRRLSRRARCRATQTPRDAGEAGGSGDTDPFRLHLQPDRPAELRRSCAKRTRDPPARPTGPRRTFVAGRDCPLARTSPSRSPSAGSRYLGVRRSPPRRGNGSTGAGPVEPLFREHPFSQSVSGAGGNRTRVLERRTRSSPGAVRDVAFLGPGAPTNRSPTGSVTIKSRSTSVTRVERQVS